jgi:hypothetical protein
MTEVVREWKTTDGIGAMLWKKLYAMSFAYRNKLLFQNTPFNWYFIHEPDQVNTQEEFQRTLNLFNDLLYDPWDEIDFESIPNLVLNKEVGIGNPSPPGFTNHVDFLLDAPIFNKVKNDSNNNIVIHMRRGNALHENPRHTSDNFYINLLSQIHKIPKMYNLDNPNIILCTDAPNETKTYKPINQEQTNIWRQPFLQPEENGEYKIISAGFDKFKEVCPQLQIINNLHVYDSYLLLLKAKVLFTANSAFSQSAGLLSHNRVFGMPLKDGISAEFNTFKNKVGTLDSSGNIIIY